MKLVRQETRWGCGQACVAMILGIDFWEAVKRVGRGKTRTKQLTSVLRNGGVTVDDRAIRAKGDLPERCIVRLRWNGIPNLSHWCLMWDGQMLDPDDAELEVLSRSHITSYIPIGEAL